MFGIVRRNGELEALLDQVASNVANNYKDAAQQGFAEFEKRFAELKNAGKLKQKQISLYEELEAEVREKLKGFTHKDQKPYWH